MGRNVSQEVLRIARFGPLPEHLARLVCSTPSAGSCGSLVYSRFKRG